MRRPPTTATGRRPRSARSSPRPAASSPAPARSPGSSSRAGCIASRATGSDPDEVALAAIDAGAEDVDTEDPDDDRDLHEPGDLERSARRSTRPASRSSRPRTRWSPSRRSSSTRARRARRSGSSSCWRTSKTSSTCRPTSTSPRTSSPRSPGDRAGHRPRDRGTRLGRRRTERRPAAGDRRRLLVTSPGPPMPERLAGDPWPPRELIALHDPAVVAVERLFFQRNVQTAMAVGQARGVVLLAAAEAGRPVREPTPNEVKSAVGGNGAADKQQVQRMVQIVLGDGGAAAAGRRRRCARDRGLHRQPCRPRKPRHPGDAARRANGGAIRQRPGGTALTLRRGRRAGSRSGGDRGGHPAQRPELARRPVSK